EQQTPSESNTFYPPVVLEGVRRDAVMFREETFGPVIGLTPFDSNEEAIDAANATEFGLAAYVFTSDTANAQRIIARLRLGHVALNSGTGPTPEAPFGGMKQSGFGREGGIEGLLEYCETQTVAEAGGA